MKYVLSGKSESFYLYVKKNKLQMGKEVKHARTREIFNKITDVDTIVLLHGWWGRSWAKEAIKSLYEVYPFIEVECLDGPFGEKERLSITQNKSSVNRFDLLDFD
jgi:hypothetical protein